MTWPYRAAWSSTYPWKIRFALSFATWSRDSRVDVLQGISLLWLHTQHESTWCITYSQTHFESGRGLWRSTNSDLECSMPGASGQTSRSVRLKSRWIEELCFGLLHLFPFHILDAFAYIELMPQLWTLNLLVVSLIRCAWPALMSQRRFVRSLDIVPSRAAIVGFRGGKIFSVTDAIVMEGRETFINTGHTYTYTFTHIYTYICIYIHMYV